MTCSLGGLRLLNGQRGARMTRPRRTVAARAVASERSETNHERRSGSRCWRAGGSADEQGHRLLRGGTLSLELGLRGLLPAVVETLEQQALRRYQAYQKQPTKRASHFLCKHYGSVTVSFVMSSCDGQIALSGMRSPKWIRNAVRAELQL